MFNLNHVCCQLITSVYKLSVECLQNEHNRKIDKKQRYANVKNQAAIQSINIISPFSTWKFKRC